MERCRGELDTWEVAKLLAHDHWLVRRECLILQFDRVTREMLQGVAISDPHWHNRDLAVQLLDDQVIPIVRVGIGVERVALGWLVEEIYPGGPADKASLKVGDLIVKIAEEGEPWLETTELPMRYAILKLFGPPVDSKLLWLEVKRGVRLNLTLEELRRSEVATLTIAVSSPY